MIRRGATEFSGLVVRTGVPLPPPAGPDRQILLRKDGLAAMMHAQRQFGSALLAIGINGPSVLNTAPAAYAQDSPPKLFRPPNTQPLKQRWKWARQRLVEVTENQLIDHAELLHAKNQLDLALTSAVAAYNLLEDEPEGFHVHRLAHAIGEVRSGLFHCPVAVKDGVAVQNCPLALLHFRMGFSIGFTATRWCSICHEDLDYCVHLLGKTYSLVAQRIENSCNICGQRSCGHVVGDSYDVHPTGIIRQVDLHEVSLVHRPRDPLARVQEFRQHVDAAQTATCDCWQPCTGFWDLGGDR